MRTIKFRAINTWFSDSKMEYFDLENAGDYILMKENSRPNEKWEVMQFIGLLDVDGNPIYEGDILENTNYIGSVVWDKFNAMFILQSFTDGDGYVFKGVKTYSPLNGKIIGNIYENPELLNPTEK